MIAVAGEALMDLVVDVDGSVSAVPGGAPMNAARTVARLGARVLFLGRVSGDGFGRRLLAELDADGVEVAVREPAAAPSSLAVAEIGEDGSARYRFYLEGTSAPELRPSDIAPDALAGVRGLLLGGLGLLVDPMAGTLMDLSLTMPPHVVVMLDPNCRPSAIRDLGTYRRRIAALLSRADILKVSTDDLVLLDPGVPPARAAVGLLERGPGVVLLTDGAGPVRVFAPGVELTVPVPEVEVVDTVGAGDAFAAAFLTWWVGRGRTRADLADARALRQATAASVAVAAITCTARGAQPPRLPGWSAGLARDGESAARRMLPSRQARTARPARRPVTPAAVQPLLTGS